MENNDEKIHNERITRINIINLSMGYGICSIIALLIIAAIFGFLAFFNLYTPYSTACSIACLAGALLSGLLVLQLKRMRTREEKEIPIPPIS